MRVGWQVGRSLLKSMVSRPIEEILEHDGKSNEGEGRGRWLVPGSIWSTRRQR